MRLALSACADHQPKTATTRQARPPQAGGGGRVTGVSASVGGSTASPVGVSPVGVSRSASSRQLLPSGSIHQCQISAPLKLDSFTGVYLLEAILSQDVFVEAIVAAVQADLNLVLCELLGTLISQPFVAALDAVADWMDPYLDVKSTDRISPTRGIETVMAEAARRSIELVDLATNKYGPPARLQALPPQAHTPSL